MYIGGSGGVPLVRGVYTWWLKGGRRGGGGYRVRYRRRSKRLVWTVV